MNVYSHNNNIYINFCRTQTLSREERKPTLPDMGWAKNGNIQSGNFLNKNNIAKTRLRNKIADSCNCVPHDRMVLLQIKHNSAVCWVWKLLSPNINSPTAIWFTNFVLVLRDIKWLTLGSNLRNRTMAEIFLPKEIMTLSWWKKIMKSHIHSQKIKSPTNNKKKKKLPTNYRSKALKALQSKVYYFITRPD